jgi:hypothetical protein
MILNNNKHIILTNRSLPSNDENIVVVKNNLRHYQRIYKKYNLAVEGQAVITAEFVLQKDSLIRYYIKELDILLKKNGIFRIILVDSQSHSKYFRSRGQVKYEFSIATNGRYCLVSSVCENGILTLSYVKKTLVLPENDSINKWSFGIVSNGEKNDWVLELISSIEDQKIPEYEIIICGPSPFVENSFVKNNNIKIIRDVVLQDDIRAPIAHKKNAIIKEAQYNNLCIMHDRYLLQLNWFENFERYGNYFDALCLKTLTSEGKRFGVDWMKFCYPLTDRFKINRALAYNEWHEEAIIPGGVILVKKNLIEPFMLDERLHWDEIEDMQFSKIAYLNGLLINIDPDNYFVARQVRHIPQSYSWYRLKIHNKYSWLRGLLINFILFSRVAKKYYKKILEQ